MDNLQLYIESLIFASTKAITIKDIKGALEAHFETKFKEKEVQKALDELNEKYNDPKYPFEILGLSGGYQFMTKGTYYPLVAQHLKLESKKKLSKAALETLAIISYKQPVTKSGMEAIRGVNCDYSVQKLLDKDLIQIKGRAEGPGRPLLYSTTEKFMDTFGLQTLDDLPKIKEFELPENEIGLRTDEEAEPAEPVVTEPIVEVEGSNIPEVMDLNEDAVADIEMEPPTQVPDKRDEEE